ncbi:discoidin domain-containing protein [Paucibacter sp. R3-3]|uniref:Discoidin domain-containing protein n=1 Tax=Roseateles agri TaxID=3098619 RepID=A0ABU5DJ06_9BURK|nr:discoidin domain-containing protein [Paucibacter sp. R3-3]MDY0746267.1 discoidin domain-containing protein [Paucibacter sp. R3-3]
MVLMTMLLAGAAVNVDLHQPWQAAASDQVESRVEAKADGRQCLHYDFKGVSGYAVMRRSLPLDWPEDFELAATLQGQGDANALQLKFADASGDNVWWLNKPGFAPPAQPRTLRAQRRSMDFAWGPAEDHTLRHTQTVELVVASTGPGAQAGRGVVCLGALSLVPRAPLTQPPQRPVLQQQGAQLLVDLGRERDFSGLLLRWAQAPAKFSISTSIDKRRWTPLGAETASHGLDALFLPDAHARWLRITGEPGMSLAELRLPSPEPGADADWPDRNAMLADLARRLPQGTLPRAFSGQQNYWTLVGVDGGAEHSALLSEDGALELGRGGPSLEPQIRMTDDKGNSRWLDWSRAGIGQSLASGELPLPSVHLVWPGLQLDVTAAADGSSTAPRLLARYTLRNTGKTALALDMQWLLRPWQVNPPQQFLNTPGGFSPIRQLAWNGQDLTLNGQPAIRPMFKPDAVRALAGSVDREALQAAAPLTTDLRDADGLVSAALARSLQLAPGESRVLDFAMALAPRTKLDGAAGFDAIEQAWQQRLGSLKLTLPPGNEALARTIKTTWSQMLLSREGAALRPGTRAYGRSWIRDGAMMAEALLRVGETAAARDFIDGFEPQIFASGKVPCCIDRFGADPVAENDSHGQYLFAVAEVWRYTHDKAWLARHWPRVQKVVAYMDKLRASTLGPDTPPQARGLMPPSISHEGYSDKAAYSFWDDFWALRGYKDAVQIAEALGQDAGPFERSRDAFAGSLAAAVRNTAAVFKLDTLSGAADRGDFDPTSSTMALDPAQAADLLPPKLLANTFVRYTESALARADGTRPQRDYTPYELRTIGALVRLGQADDAQALLQFFFKDQRPAAWHQWAEVVMREPREPKFLGDMPHAWVASDFLRSALDLFAYERESDGALVLGAGISAPMRLAGDVGIAGLRTHGGRLDWTLLRTQTGWRLAIEQRPAGTPLRLAWPDGELPRARLNGQTMKWEGRELPIPAEARSIEFD